MTPPDPRALRDAFGSFMTGVTVVTTREADGTPVGFTANSFASVSLDPPLLSVCPGKFLSSYESFAACTRFAVSILAEGQEDVSNIFARFKGDRFAEVAHRSDLHGNPLIYGAAAHFSCTLHQRIEAGDHSILIGRVDAFEHAKTRGLGYVAGRYFSLGAEREALANMGGGAVCGAIVEAGGAVLLERTPSGLRPPQMVPTDRRTVLDQLRTALEALGLCARIGRAYSVFTDARSGTHYSYFLARQDESAPLPEGLVAIPVSELAAQSYASPAIATMMTRFALEAGTRSFGLYLGDADDGAVHDMMERV
ncbi:flavin reductase family protein [Roseovarius aquimarinus]|uniref:Flavin reductase family protein n=1 Tax=Roseovarius aquimarinus TaxID=1229156 RepID=A0ABW7I640_9RHOB